MTEQQTEWTIRHRGRDVLIYGPGSLVIYLRDYLSRPAPRLRPTHDATVTRRWAWELDDGVLLELVSRRNPERPSEPETHILQAGLCIRWTVPQAFAEQLHNPDTFIPM
jgi:hypothetical protein